MGAGGTFMPPPSAQSNPIGCQTPLEPDNVLETGSPVLSEAVRTSKAGSSLRFLSRHRTPWTVSTEKCRLTDDVKGRPSVHGCFRLHLTLGLSPVYDWLHGGDLPACATVIEDSLSIRNYADRRFDLFLT